MKWKSNVRNRIALYLAMMCVCVCVRLFVWQVQFTLVCPTFRCTQCAVCLLRDLTAPNIYSFSQKFYFLCTFIPFLCSCCCCCCCFIIFIFLLVALYIFDLCGVWLLLVALSFSVYQSFCLYRFVHSFILVNFVHHFGAECVLSNFLWELYTVCVALNCRARIQLNMVTHFSGGGGLVNEKRQEKHHHDDDVNKKKVERPFECILFVTKTSPAYSMACRLWALLCALARLSGHGLSLYSTMNMCLHKKLNMDRYCCVVLHLSLPDADREP